MNRSLLLFFVAAVLLTIKLGSSSYLESSEARYAEISREMALTNDWVTPRLMEIKHFHKPPLTYWVTAVAFKIFGVNGLSGKLLLILAALGTLWFTIQLCQLLFPRSPATATWSFFILLTSPLFLIQSRALTTDIYLTFFTTGAIYFHWKNHLRKSTAANAAGVGLFLGLAFLTKGPIPFIFFLLPYFTYQLTVAKRLKISWRNGIVTLAILLAVVLPWFILMILRNPGLLNYFLVFQTVDRFASHVHHRGGPAYYYLGVLLVGMLFWFTAYFPAVFRQLKHWASSRRDTIRFLLLHYTLVPAIFFSFSGSKLPAYILPALPFLAIYVSAWFTEDSSSRYSGIQWVNILLALGLPLSLLLRMIPSLPPALESHRILFYLLLLPGLFMIILVYKGRLKNWLTGLTYGGYNLLLFFIIVALLPYFEGETKNFEPIAKIINANWQEPACIASYHLRLPSLEFYTGKRVLHILHDRELQFETAESLRNIEPWLSEDPDKLARLFHSDSTCFAVIGRKDWQRYSSEHLDLAGLVDTLHTNSRFLLLSSKP